LPEVVRIVEWFFVREELLSVSIENYFALLGPCHAEEVAWKFIVFTTGIGYTIHCKFLSNRLFKYRKSIKIYMQYVCTQKKYLYGITGG
jgi:hypothetical protein